MKKRTQVLLALGLCLGIFTGCTAGTAESTDNANGVLDKDTVSLSSDDMFTDRDKEIGYSEEDSVKIELSDGASTCDSDTVVIDGDKITITGEGTYIVGGYLSDGQLVVEAGEKDKLQIVLDGVEISCSASAALYVKQADKVFVTTTNGSENSLSTKGEFKAVDDNNIDAAVFSKEDLTFNGAGNLTVKCEYGHGIVSKDDLVFTSGSYSVTSGDHGVSGKNSVRVAGGEFAISCAEDGIHSENDDDVTLGFIYIAGGSMEIAAGDDGIHAGTQVSVLDGAINITESYEGIEGMTVTISGGIVDISASDDGINAADPTDTSGTGDEFGGMGGFKGEMPEDFTGEMPENPPEDFTGEIPGERPEGFTDKEPDDFPGKGAGGAGGFGVYNENCQIYLNGGQITISAGGDGVDSNGDLTVTGGTIIIYGCENGADSAIDYEGTALISGGTVVATGASAMAMGFSESSSQASVMYTLSENHSAGSQIIFSDSQGAVIAELTAEKRFQTLNISTPDLKMGETYTIDVDGESYEVELTSAAYSNGGGMGGGFMGGGFMGGGFGRGERNSEDGGKTQAVQ